MVGFCRISVLLLITLWVNELSAQVMDDEKLGLHLGKFHTYAHQVSGDVYAVDEYTLLIKGFQYDGLGKDTFFWAGSTVRPSNVGFIVPDEHGKTNKLARYTSKDLTIRLPDNKKLTSIKWFAVWDLREHNNYGDIYISEGFEPPSPQHLGELTKAGGLIKSRSVIIMDSKTILIPEFTYDGSKPDMYFWAGVGSIPDENGEKVPDEKGYLNALSVYEGEDVLLELPGKMTFFDINWFAIWNSKEKRNYGSLLIPGGLNIPPALINLKEYSSSLPNCEQLHKRLQLSWEVFGPQITFQLAGQIDEDDYMAIGTSGSSNSSAMLNGDAAVTFMVGHSGFVQDYNITDKYPCTNVLGLHRGVCPDAKVGGNDNYQFQSASRLDGITTITFRRQLDNAGDHGDAIFEKESETFLIWAIGKYNAEKEPGFHHTFPKGDQKVTFGRKLKKNCFAFSQRSMEKKTVPWKQFQVQDQKIHKISFHLGPPGGTRGYQAITGFGSPGLVWYVNGAMTPKVFVKRGQKYQLRVEGGNSAHNARFYHPLYITDDSSGGYAIQTKIQRDATKVFAGIRFDSKGRPQPIAAGRLCIWEGNSNSSDPRKADDFVSFPKYRDSLKMRCEKGDPALLDWTPDETTPDVLYYQSYSQKNMGWKIFIVDDLEDASSSHLAPNLNLLSVLLVAILIVTSRFI